MSAKRELSMRQLRTLLRLRHDGVSAREIGRRLGVARSTIQDNLKRGAAAGLAWPLADDVTDAVLEQRLYGRAELPAPGVQHDSDACQPRCANQVGPPVAIEVAS